jgi:hypothetical protein
MRRITVVSLQKVGDLLATGAMSLPPPGTKVRCLSCGVRRVLTEAEMAACEAWRGRCELRPEHEKDQR